MIEFRPTLSRGKSAQREPSPQSIISRSVANLDVVCVGVEDGTLYFRLKDKRQLSNDEFIKLADAINASLSKNAATAEILKKAAITGISIE